MLAVAVSGTHGRSKVRVEDTALFPLVFLSRLSSVHITTGQQRVSDFRLKQLNVFVFSLF